VIRCPTLQVSQFLFPGQRSDTFLTDFVALLFLDHGTRRGWGFSVSPRPLFTPEKDPVPIVQEAGWAPGPVWTARKISPPPGFDPWSVHPVTSRYTDYATRPNIMSVCVCIPAIVVWHENSIFSVQHYSCHLWPVWIYRIFTHYFIKATILGGGGG